jgi:hypothetical protein
MPASGYPVLTWSYTPSPTVTLHPGAHGSITGANSGTDYVVTLTNGAAFPAVTVNAAAGWTFTGWTPATPATVTGDFVATAQYSPSSGSFERWLSEHSISGDPATLFRQHRAGDGLPYGHAYAFGSNLPTDGPAQKIIVVNGRPVFEIPAQDEATLPDVGLHVRGSTDLVDWTLPVIQVEGAAAGRVRYQLDGLPTRKAFFKLEAEWTSNSDFPAWLSDHGLSGDPAVLFRQDRNGDGVPNGIEYACGGNLPADTPLLKMRMVNGHPVVETPAQDAATSTHAVLRVFGSTDLIHWTLPVAPAADTTGKPANRDWHEPEGPLPPNAFFRLEAELK